MLWRQNGLALVHSKPASQKLSVLSFRRYVANASNSYRDVASVLALARAADHQIPKPVEVIGHVRTIRNQKRWSFVELGDGSTTVPLQALLDPAQATGLGTGTSVRISGLWQPCPSGKEQSHELHARSVEVLGTADAEKYPLQKKYHSSEFLRTIPHLRLRVPFQALLARLRSDCEHYVSNHFRAQQYVRTYPPIITSSDCEGAGDVFTLHPRLEGELDAEHGESDRSKDFFRGPKYLTVSSQLHLEACIHEHPRVWTLSPTFRAEKSDTPRHLSEFYMLEAEIRAVKLSDIMDTVESLIRDVSANVQDSPVGEELLGLLQQDNADAATSQMRPEALSQRWNGLKKPYWPRITYSRAMEFLQAAEVSGEVKFNYKPTWNAGLHLEHERFIASEIGLGSPVFVTDYPQDIKPFYMLPSDLSQDLGHSSFNEQTVACFDLLLPEVCEVVGGSLREHRLSALQESMTRHGLLEDGSALASSGNLEWYLDLRRYGSVPHGGFGLGFDRLLSYIAGVDNVRDVVPWPRYYGRCDG